MFALLLILSLDNAVVYNFHHDRTMDLLLDPSFSGWKVNLLFLYESRQPWQVSTANGVLLILLAERGRLAVRDSHVARFDGRRQLLAERNGRPATASCRGDGGDCPCRRHRRRSRDRRLDWVLVPNHGACCRAGRSAHARRAGPLDQFLLLLRTRSNWRKRRHRRRATPAHRFLEAVDSSVAKRHEAWTLPGYSDWLEMPGRIRVWFQEAHGREPSNGEVGHFMYQWREEHVPAMEIRRRIFVSAGNDATLEKAR